MTGAGRGIWETLRSWAHRLGTAVTSRLRALLPPITPAVFFRALCGVLLFLCGLVAGVWLIFRYRRHEQGSS